MLFKLGLLEWMWCNLRWRQKTTFKAYIYKSCDEIFYGTEFEIWVGFGQVGSTENCHTEPIVGGIFLQLFILLLGSMLHWCQYIIATIKSVWSPAVTQNCVPLLHTYIIATSLFLDLKWQFSRGREWRREGCHSH